MYLTRKTSGFTLIEIVIAMTIFAVMSVAILSIYIQTTTLGQKLRLTRQLTETSREITERIAEDVRTLGISLSGSKLASAAPWDTFDYTQSGGLLLGIGSEDKIDHGYFYGSQSGGILGECTTLMQSDPYTHCGLYRVAYSGSSYNFSTAWNAVDSFVPLDEKKRVKIEDLKFFISGDGVSTEKKVTLVMTLGLMPRSGVPVSLIANTKYQIQTTISERFYK